MMTATETPLVEERVVEIFERCLFERASPRLYVEGALYQVSFCSPALERNKTAIGEMLLCLPESFMGEQGDDLAKAGVDNTGRIWTKRPSVKEQLMLLGLAHGFIEITKKYVHTKPDVQPHFRVLADRINQP